MTNPSPVRQATSLFLNRFASRPAVAASSPGRINLLGEHTDYNGGPVLPLAIERRTAVVASPAEDRLAVSTIDPEPRSFRDDTLSGGWADFIAAVARAMQKRAHRIAGAHLAIASSVPVGAGLSSSAALSLATAKAFALLAGLRLPVEELIEIAWRTEHDELGVPCGRMDQTASGMGVRGHALLFECATGVVTPVPMPGRIWVFETGVTHKLSDSEYPVRRKECEEAVAHAQERGIPIHALAELTAEQLTAISPWLPPSVAKRARHVVTETIRTRQAAAALGRQDLAEVGRLMLEGHRSLRDDFQSSCAEADLIVDSVVRHGGLGARLTGAGWGGAVVALLPEERSGRIAAEVGRDFSDAYGRPLATWSTRAVSGVRREQPTPAGE
jgi:galactokinase